MELWELDQALKAVAPVDGVDSAKRIAFQAAATQAQKDAATAIAVAADLTTPTDPDKRATERFDDMEKIMKAALLVMRSYCNGLQAGTYTQKTILQLKADYITAFKALP